MSDLAADLELIRAAAVAAGNLALAAREAGLEEPVTANRMLPSACWSRTKRSSPDSGWPGSVP